MTNKVSKKSVGLEFRLKAVFPLRSKALVGTEKPHKCGTPNSSCNLSIQMSVCSN